MGTEARGSEQQQRAEPHEQRRGRGLEGEGGASLPEEAGPLYRKRRGLCTEKDGASLPEETGPLYRKRRGLCPEAPRLERGAMAGLLDPESLLARVQRRLELASLSPNSDGGTGTPCLPSPRPALSLSDRRNRRLQGPSGGGTKGMGPVDGGRKEGKENGWSPQPGRAQGRSISSDDSSEDELPSFCMQGCGGLSQGAQLWRGHIESSSTDKAVQGAGIAAKEAAGHGKVSPAAMGRKEPALTGPQPPQPKSCFDSSDDDNEFETFLLKMKTPLKSKTHLKSVSRAAVISSGSDLDEEDFKSARARPVLSKRRTHSQPAALHQGVLGSRRVANKKPNPEPEPCVPPLRARSVSLSVGSGTTNSTTLDRPQRASEPLPAVPAPPPTTAQASKRSLADFDEFDDEFESLMDKVRKSNSKKPGRKNKPTTPSMAKQGLPSVPLWGQEPPAQIITPQLPATPRQPPALPRSNRVKSGSDLELGKPIASVPSQSNDVWSTRLPPKCAVPGCFLAELSSPSCHYVRNFKKCKAQLTASLYKFYNETVFKNKLPNNMELLWNNKMRKTAGYCVMGKGPGPACQPYARIELSVKVCDNAERLRDTLVHEMCHAATWLINGQRDGHGRLWQLYARTATLVHPELPTVSRCHTYNITFKYRYECTRCKNSIGRHSKSLDTERFVCALCQGRFVLLPPEGRGSTPVASRALTPFTRFVKEQYGTTRSARPDSSHADIMRILGEQFSKSKLQ
ncbi:unnamed protein product [Lampetra fluviatilis]